MKYTPEITEKLKKDYLELNKSVDEIAEELGTKRRSIIAKLSSLGIYKKTPYVDKTGNPPIKKSQYIESIALELNLPIELVDSLEKVNKYVLQAIDNKFKEQHK